MIKINLLPSEAGKRPTAASKKAKVSSAGMFPYMLVLIVLLGAAVYGAYLSYQMGEDSTWTRRRTEATKRRKKEEVKRRQEEFELHNASIQEIEGKYQVAQALIPENRIFWSEKINMLAKARVHLAVYVTKLTLNERVDELETPESVARREAWRKQQHAPGEEEPAPVKVPVINQWLDIDAIAYGNDSPTRLNQLNAFNAVLQTMTWKRDNGKVVKFVDGMSTEFEFRPHRTAPVAGIEVLRFGLTCKAEPQMEQSAPKAEGQAAGGGQ